MSLPALKNFQSLAIASWWRSEALMPMVFLSTTFHQRWCETDLCFVFPYVVLPKGGSCAIAIKPVFFFFFFHIGTTCRQQHSGKTMVSRVRTTSCMSKSINFSRSLNLVLIVAIIEWDNANGKSVIWLGGSMVWRK